MNRPLNRAIERIINRHKTVSVAPRRLIISAPNGPEFPKAQELPPIWQDIFTDDRNYKQGISREALK